MSKIVAIKTGEIVDTAYEAHPLASLFPVMKGAAYEALRDDISEHGLRDPIRFYEGKVLDGRNRVRACQELGIRLTPRQIFEVSGDPLAFVLSMKNRQHLTESQRAMAGARIANMDAGRPNDTLDAQTRPIDLVSQAQAATMLTVSPKSVKRAVSVLACPDPDLHEVVDDGLLKVSVGASLTYETEAFRAAVIAKIRAGMKATEAIRLTRKEFLPAEVAKLPNGIFRVIYADPPWAYNDARRTDDHRQSTGAFDHYGDMTIDELCALDVKSIAADDSVLLMWGTFPLLPEALRVIEAWGFKYKTAFLWDKGHGCFGHYHDAEAEFMIVSTRGSCTPDIATKEKQIQRFPRAEHSRKPDDWRKLIDRLWVHGPRVELFRRGDAPQGWTVWGNEAK